MSLRFIQETVFLKKLVFKIWLWDARQKMARIGIYLKKSDKLLDVGTGPGSVCLLLKKNKFNITPLDIQDLSLTDEVKPEIYDGKRMPFKNDTFDIALILTVLHHTSNHEEIVLEAKRVAKRIIIIEDIYRNTIQKYLTYFMDSLVNFEFCGHPHTNKNDEEWKRLFNKLDLKLKDAQYNVFLLFFRQATYYLEK